MSTDESYIGGSNKRRMQMRAPRGSKKAKPKRVAFTRERKEIFLAHFAATANANAAARAAGVSKSTVYAHRRKDPRFNEGWYEALGEGVARAEAQSVRWAEKAFTIRASEKAARAAQNMDPKVALAILESYRRNRGRRPGEILPQPYDKDEVRARLEAKMRALGMLDEQGRPIAKDDPSTASRHSPRTGEEDR
jgi:hypothetical protein